MGSRIQEGTQSGQWIAAHVYVVDLLSIVVSFQHSSPEGLQLQPALCMVNWNLLMTRRATTALDYEKMDFATSQLDSHFQ